MLPRVDPRAYLGGIRASPRGCSRVPRGEVSVPSRCSAALRARLASPHVVTRASPQGEAGIPPGGSGRPHRGCAANRRGRCMHPRGAGRVTRWGGPTNPEGSRRSPLRGAARSIGGCAPVPAIQSREPARAMRPNRASHATEPREPCDQTVGTARPIVRGGDSIPREALYFFLGGGFEPLSPAPASAGLWYFDESNVSHSAA